MNIVINELSIEQINTALLRITRAIQSNTNNFQNDVEKAVANVTITGKTTIQKYDDSRLMAIVNELNQKYNNLSDEQASIRNKIVSLETILANVALDYDPETNELTYSLGDYSNSVTLRDTTYTFSYDDETGAFTIVDDFTGETVFSETFNDTTYTFSFDNGILTVHNNLLNTNQTFNFDARYYTESEIQSLILDKIPPEASSSNQLADKAFVNSSISTATATFRGTVTTTQALEALTGDLNDYAYLQNIDPVTGQTISYDRYKWVESGGDYGHWKYEYTLNNSSFTADQWAAINSGITCQIVTDLLNGCYSGDGSSLCKSAGNEWRSLLATNCDCTDSVKADYIYYNTNVRVNQCNGALSATCYCVYDKGWVPFTKYGINASDIGLVAGCCYPMTCFIEQLRCCYGKKPGAYKFTYANACNAIINETGSYAYSATFIKLDAIDANACWQRENWKVINTDGKEWSIAAVSAGALNTYTWVVCPVQKYHYAIGEKSNSDVGVLLSCACPNDWGATRISCGCPLTFNTCTGTLTSDNFYGKNPYHCRVDTAGGTLRYVTIELDNDGGWIGETLRLDINAWGASYHALFREIGCASSCVGIVNAWYDDICYGLQCFGRSNVAGNTCVVYFAYTGYRPFSITSNIRMKCVTRSNTAPENVCWVEPTLGAPYACFCRRSAASSGLCYIALSGANTETMVSNFQVTGASAPYPLQYLADYGRILTHGVCADLYYTNSCCKCFTPSSASEVWIHVGCFSAGGTDTKSTNTQDLTLVASGSGMVSAVHLTILSSSAANPVIKMDKAGYYISTGISCILITRTGSSWNCVNNVYARVLPYTSGSTTSPFNFSLYRNQISERWSTCISYCSTLPSETVVWASGCLTSSGSEPVFSINNSLDVGIPRYTSSSEAGCPFTRLGKGWTELSTATPFIDMHYCCYCGDYSHRILADCGALCFTVNNGRGCTASTQSSTFIMRSTGLLEVSGNVLSCNTLRRSTAYSSNTYSSGWYLVAQLSSKENASGNHDITLGGYVDMTCGSTPNLRRFCFKTALRGNKCTLNAYYAFIEPYGGSDYLRVTRDVNTTDCTFTLRIYAKVCGNYTRINTTIDYYGGGDVNAVRGLNSSDITFPNTYVADEASMAGTQITLNCNCGTLRANDIHVGYVQCASCSYVRINCNETSRKIQINGQAGVDKGFLLTTNNCICGCCNIGMEIGSGNISRGIYQYNASGTFQWLLYWDATLERHNCPVAFACSITASGGVCSCWTCIIPFSRICSFPANSKSYVLLGCFKPTNDVYANNLELGFSVGGSSLVSKGSIKALLTTASCCLNCFCNNNIEVKYSNYLNSQFGVSSIGFTTSGSCWNCCIGVWLEICNCSSSACCWNVSLFRNLVTSVWSTSMTCQSTMPTFVCAIQIPACRRNFYYNNADAMINTWAYDGRYDSGSCKCMVFTFQICGVGELRAPTHQKIFLSTTGTGVSTPLNMWIEYMKGTCKDYIAACYAGGDSEVIVPMRISSDHDNSIYIDYAVCCDVARQFCTHIYDSGNMPAGAQGNSAIINDLSGCWLYDAAGGYNLERNTQVVFNVDCPNSQYVTNVITAQTIAACCVATTSDIRQKKDIKPYNNGLSLVKNLDIISFRYLGENNNDIEHISIPANWSCQLISGKGQNQLRVNDAVGILLSAVKDLGHSMTLWQRIRLWFYKKFVEAKTNKVLEEKVKYFTNK